MRILIFFPAIFLLSSISFGQQAIIVVQADSSDGQMLYLTRFHAPGLEYDRIDSAKVSGQPVRFTVVPDPIRPYEIRLGCQYVCQLYLAAGDSLIYHYSPSNLDLVFDRIGANKAAQDTAIRPQSQWLFYRAMGDRNWASTRSYVTAIRQKMETEAGRLLAQFPEHPGLASALRADALRWYYEPQLRYFYRYFDSSEGIASEDPNHLKFIDSIQWSHQDLVHSSDMDGLVSEWLNLAGWRSGIHGPETSEKDRDEVGIEIAFTLPPPSRDVAILTAMKELTWLSPSKAVAIGERAIARYRPLASDTAYLIACEKSLDAIRSRLPGKLAPAFSLPDSTGRLHALADFRGKVIYLDFWGTWCHPCVQELPALRKLEEKFAGDTSIAFVSIAIEYRRLAAWKKFLQTQKLPATQLYAEGQFHNETARAYGIEGVPTYMLINRDGTFIDAAAPRPSSGKAEAAIRNALTKSGD
ncbi:MAG: TlpA disulfide reductase family protein [Bacteroidota bacterium]|nr:TlpA disulfide reductase family protein [Bacteroidota bacterium]MDP4233962.1 TlpA disulfide reductase family protein [Bacteroidota bacterium]MDP4242787.1 TlpA disulfide reductase family protein [Bacteroidota bacterium]MDP4288501.1 TlpA disulfide reductase family protein [Bacteroidota bacterium]